MGSIGSLHESPAAVDATAGSHAPSGSQPAAAAPLESPDPERRPVDSGPRDEQANGEGPAGSPDLRERVRKLQTLAEVSRALTNSLHVDRVLDQIITGSVAVIDAADSGILTLLDEQTGKLVVRAAVGFAEGIRDMEIVPGHGLTGDAFATAEAAIHDEAAAAARMATLSQAQRRVYRQASGDVSHPRAAMVAPLMANGRPIGAMVVENLRTPHSFDDFDLELLRALADQAAIALVNASLYAAESRSRDGLSRSLEVHETLTNLVLQGHTVADIAETLAERLGTSVRITDAFCNIIARSARTDEEPKLTAASIGIDADDPSTLADALELTKRARDHLAVPVSGPTDLMGLVVVGPVDSNRDELAFAAAGHAAVAVGLLMLKEREIAEAERRLHGDLIQALLSGERTDVHRRAGALGLDPTGAYAIGILAQCPNRPTPPEPYRISRLRRMVESHLSDKGDGVVIERESRLIVLKRATPSDAGDTIAEMRRWWSSLELACRPSSQVADLLIVAGPVCEAIEQLSSGFPEVDTAASMLLRMDVTCGLVFTDTMGAYHLLLQVPERRILTEFAQRVLAPIDEYDARHGTDLGTTARCYLSDNRRLGATAKRLHLHPHSVKYRLQRIADITNGDGRAPDFWLELELALKIRDLLEGAPPRRAVTVP